MILDTEIYILEIYQMMWRFIYIYITCNMICDMMKDWQIPIMTAVKVRQRHRISRRAQNSEDWKLHKGPGCEDCSWLFWHTTNRMRIHTEQSRVQFVPPIPQLLHLWDFWLVFFCISLVQNPLWMRCWSGGDYRWTIVVKKTKKKHLHLWLRSVLCGSGPQSSGRSASY